MEKRIKELEKKRVPCEIYSRVVGYIRPINQWNDSKKEEFDEREVFDSVLKMPKRK